MRQSGVLSAVTLAVMAGLATADAPKTARPDLEVSLLVDGGMTETPHYFILKVNFSGEIEGGGDLNPGLPPPLPRLSVSAHAELAALLRQERFFAMPHGIGACPPDLGFRSISAWQGTKQHSVTFCLDREGVRLRDAQSVLRVWYGVLAIAANGKPTRPVGLDKELLARKP